MNVGNELPEEVIAELEAGRKVAAIKKLRAMRGTDLAEAKRLVDSHIQQQPGAPGPETPPSETGTGRILLLIMGVGLIFILYRYFG